KSSVISHREVGTDVLDFASGVRMATRQDADVLLLGELRDHETISRALDAAEMGMLVLSTVHTNSVASTIDRVIDVFPGDQQPLARTVLSGSLVGVVSQILVPRADGRGRCAALEIMFKTPALPSIIRDGNTTMIDSLIQAGKSQGMQLMDDALFAMVRDGLVAPRTGFLAAKDKARFEKLHPATTTGATATVPMR
ncbi:MAG: ATPase, T2SS/T4P/T4SS family, partial [Myxococcota bacterium]